MLQFSKLLHHKGVKITLVTTLFTYKTILHKSSGLSGSYFAVETISDGYDQGGVKEAESVEAYLKSFKQKLSSSSCPVDCIVYDVFIPWPLDVAKKFGIAGAVFFTQSCAIDNIYYHAHKGLLKLPLTKYDQSKILVPGLPPLEPWDMPSMLYDFGSYPAVYDIVMGQFSNVVDWMAKFLPLITIGPTIPSYYLDKRLENDREYGVNLFKPNIPEQMKELAWGLRSSKCKFLWVVRESEAAKLPKGFILAHEYVGCFVTHCSWNLTLEALSLRVLMVALPQWTDQSTNAKYIMDVWEDVVEHCIIERIEGKRGEEIKRKALEWKELARKAVDEVGSSSKNIDEFTKNVVQQKAIRVLGEM
ncbi:hypothetical protein D8674_017836 [Pyrus ussuriensis x Pyrus communis]|uniref:UDP-glycosyltransferase 74F2-like n=1 Tax=Pyrus ussuriensis x Pyrus communis TaxID=2448454 RepID=A0A5N5HDU1_9ROSA|nr:hypothetical protein D8674_017836 [Pyrus ussuriensis x Pyrus communis]